MKTAGQYGRAFSIYRLAPPEEQHLMRLRVIRDFVQNLTELEADGLRLAKLPSFSEAAPGTDYRDPLAQDKTLVWKATFE